MAEPVTAQHDDVLEQVDQDVVGVRRRAATEMPETAECTIAGALRLEKLPALPHPSAVKPRAQSRACGAASSASSVRGSTWCLSRPSSG